MELPIHPRLMKYNKFPYLSISFIQEHNAWIRNYGNSILPRGNSNHNFDWAEHNRIGFMLAKRLRVSMMDYPSIDIYYVPEDANGLHAEEAIFV